MSTESPDPNDIVKNEPTVMEMISSIIQSPNARDQVEVVKELVALKEHMEDRAARKAFALALQQLQSNLPKMVKDGIIVDRKNVVRSRYVTVDKLDDVLRPLMAAFGFSFVLSETGITDQMREFCGTLIHVQGHEKTLQVHLPLDKSDFRTAVQSEGSTLSYARRQLYKAHFNIVERGEDDDGSGQNVEPIEGEDRTKVEALLKETRSNTTAFCDYFNIKTVADMKKADLAKAMEMLERRQAKQKQDAEKKKEKDENPPDPPR